MADQYVRFSTRGGPSPAYMGVTAHPQAVVAYRPDAPNNRKMIDQGFMSEPFEHDISELQVCSDPACAGLFFFKGSSDWDRHVHYRHTARPGSPLAELQAQHAAKIAAYDQAVEAEHEAREKRDELEVEVEAIKRELATIEKPKRLPAKKRAAVN